MAVHADLAVAVEVVEQHVVAGELVLVGGDGFSPYIARLGSPLPAGLPLGVPEVAEHLVVGAVLLDDVEHVLDRAGLADLGGDHANRCGSGARWNCSGV